MTAHIAIYQRLNSEQQDTKGQLPDVERWTNAQELPGVG